MTWNVGELADSTECVVISSIDGTTVVETTASDISSELTVDVGSEYGDGMVDTEHTCCSVSRRFPCLDREQSIVAPA